MDIMNLLSEEDTQKLVEYAKKLKELSNREEKLMNKAKELIEKGSLIDKNKTNLIDKSKDVINLENGIIMANINNSFESDEFINLVTKSNDYRIEEEKINNEASIINKELDEISESRLSLKNKINDVLSSVSKKNVGINVESIGSVYIIKSDIPDNIDKISPDLCEIINCSINLIEEISETFNSNITSFEYENDIDQFNKLKTYASNYDFNRDDIYEKQLELLSKTIEINTEKKEEKIVIPNEEKTINLEKAQENIKPEPVVKEIIQEKPIIEEKITETPTLEQVLGEDKKIDTIVPLSDVLNMNVTEEEKTNEDVLYLIKGDRVVPNQIARATKDKLYNKIMHIFEGSYPKTIIKSVNDVNEVDVNDGFNIESFVTNKVA